MNQTSYVRELLDCGAFTRFVASFGRPSGDKLECIAVYETKTNEFAIHRSSIKSISNILLKEDIVNYECFQTTLEALKDTPLHHLLTERELAHKKMLFAHEQATSKN